MFDFSLSSFLIITIFCLGYVAIILEHYHRINKTAVSLLIAVGCWMIYFLSSFHYVNIDLQILGKHVSDVSQIIFFLMGAMALVEVVDSHKGFSIVTNAIRTTSKRKMLWVIAFITFFLSAVLDNLTTTIVMVSLLRKLVPEKKERLLLCCLVVIAANAGGAWTPIGDVTTTMLWINGNLSSIAVMKALFVPSLISVLVPLLIYTFQVKGKYPQLPDEGTPEPGAKLVFYVGIGALVFVPIFKAVTGLPPFMGMLLGLATLWVITDILHFQHSSRQHLRVTSVLTRIDTPGILFFLGILLCINALEVAGILDKLSLWLDETVQNQGMIATLIGLFSAIIDNVPLVAATMGMYSKEAYPMDASLWHMIAYAAGTGGSILLIGSAAGVALMGLEKIDFLSYLKKATLPALIGYLLGMVAYLILR